MQFYILNIFVILLCISIVKGEKSDYQSDDYVIFLEKNISSHKVSDKFLSFGLDSSLLRDFENLPIKNEKLINLGYHLKPAYIRIGGTSSDCLYFNKTHNEKNFTEKKSSKNYFPDSQDISNFTITSRDFLSLYKFTQKISSRMIFDLNTLFRNPDGSWNSTNAEEIILFSKGHELEIDWQMGNEPNSFHHVFNVSVSAEQFAEDYCLLRKILDNAGYEQSILIGPEANHIGVINNGNKFVKNFLKKGRHCIDFLTWHQYYLNGHIAKKEDFYNSSVFERLPEQINSLKKTIKLSGQNISMWLSETSSAFGTGAPKLSNRYLAGFLWLDKLGVSAKAGIQVVIRQSLYGGNYTMIGYDLEPNPDWWVSVMFKKLVSSRVLNFATLSKSDNVRIYAHCTSKKLQKISKIVIYGINVDSQGRKIFLKHPSEKMKVLAYMLTSDDLQSRRIFLNGEILQLQNDGKLPFFKPKIMNPSKPITLPPYSMFFLLINNLDMPICEE